MEEFSTIQKIAVMAMPLVFAIVFHEVAHGWVANRLGDPTARDLGRLTLNPIPHIDLIGTIIMPLVLYFGTNGQFVFGYAKPVPIDPRYFKDPKKGMALSSLAGPGINLLMAILFSLVLRVIFPAVKESDPSDISGRALFPIALMLSYGVLINVALAVLNLIPVPPLDGSRIVYWLLPERLGAIYYRLERFGMLILMALLVFRVLGAIIWPVVIYVLYFLLGQEILQFLVQYLLS
jgi:Zn-dependent protease